MKKIKLLILLFLFLFAGFSFYSFAQEASAVVMGQAELKIREDIVSFVKKAVEYAKVNGKEQALQEFMNKNGEFIKEDLYIYAYDFSGNVISHGGQRELVGKNLIEMKDSNGVEVIKELIKLAQKGQGWLKYIWPNPAHGQELEVKYGFVMKVDDNWWLGSGYYHSVQ